MVKKEQAILITGATRGIGKAAALHLARHGHLVFATGRDTTRLAELEREASTEKLAIKVAPLDVTDTPACTATVTQAIKEFGRLDALVNNAAYSLWGPLEELALDEVRSVFETNLFSVMGLCQTVLPHMRDQQHGTIINIGSVAGNVAAPVEGPYSMTKFALHSFSRALRMEVAGFGIRVVLLEPGVIKTDFQANKVIGDKVFGAKSAYMDMSQATALRARAREFTAQGPKNVAKRIRDVVESENPNPRYVVGIDAAAGAMATRLFPDRLLDFFVRRSVTGT